jgi:hypothetical protein
VTAEWWVMRVLPILTAAWRDNSGTPNGDWSLAGTLFSKLVRAGVEDGTLAILPDNSVADPLNCYETEAEARAELERCKARWPFADFRLVFNADDVSD